MRMIDFSDRFITITYAESDKSDKPCLCLELLKEKKLNVVVISNIILFSANYNGTY